MHWFVFNNNEMDEPKSFPDDFGGEAKVTSFCTEMLSKGYTPDEIIIIRGERKKLVPPSGSYQLVDTGPEG